MRRNRLRVPSDAATDPHGGFLSRWSRLKSRRSASDDTADTPPPQPAPEEGPGSAPSEVAVLTDDDMPSLDQLDESSDHSMFFSPGVSDHLRKTALRKLFRSPKFNIRDGLDDYDDDFTRFTPMAPEMAARLRERLKESVDRLQSSSDVDETAITEFEPVPDARPAQGSDAEAAGEETEPDDGDGGKPVTGSA